MQGGETESKQTSQGPDHNAFHELSNAFLDERERPESISEIRRRLGDRYDDLPERMRASLEGMTSEELAEIGKMAAWFQERDLTFELPGGKVCLF